MIELKNVSLTYGEARILKNISFRISPKELVCITGPSGAGKSTLLHMMIGAEMPTSGQVQVDGINIALLPPTILQLYRRRIGVAFQDYKLLWNRTVAENVAFPLEVAGVPNEVITKRVSAVLKDMNVYNQRNTIAKALSGGEKARVSIARAYVHQPMLLFADEPTGNLDPEKTDEIITLLQQIHQNGTTVVLATHEADIVDELQTRVLRLEAGELIRDSVGGYDKEKRRQPKVIRKGLHDIFEEDDGRKVKITALG